MKHGQFIEYNKRKVSLEKYTENEAGRLVPDPSSFSKKAQYEVKSKWSAA